MTRAWLCEHPCTSCGGFHNLALQTSDAQAGKQYGYTCPLTTEFVFFVVNTASNSSRPPPDAVTCKLAAQILNEPYSIIATAEDGRVFSIRVDRKANLLQTDGGLNVNWISRGEYDVLNALDPNEDWIRVKSADVRAP